MSRVRGFAYVAIAGAALLALGCGDSAGPLVPKTVAIAAGDSQSAPTGGVLPVPLRVTVLGSNGQPYPGATVTWTVPTGQATPTPGVSASDSQGVAQTIVTLGAQIGPVVIQASVPGVPPVSFKATAIDPCTFVVPYTLGTTINGTLATTDCLLGGNYYTDFYGLAVASQQGLTITQGSNSFDTWLDLYRADGAYLAYDDDVQPGVNTNSQIEVIVAPGSYILAPNSYDAQITGPYALTAVTRPQTLAGCTLVWITRGVTVTDDVGAGDCTDTTGGTHYYDVVGIVALSGTVLTVAQRSTAFNALLTLYRVDPSTGNLIFLASNDDSSGTTTNAFIAATAPSSAVYVLFMGTSAASETGAYTLAVSSSTTAASAAAGRVAPQPVPMLRMPKLGAWGSKPLPRSRPFR